MECPHMLMPKLQRSVGFLVRLQDCCVALSCSAAKAPRDDRGVYGLGLRLSSRGRVEVVVEEMGAAGPACSIFFPPPPGIVLAEKASRRRGGRG